MPKMQTANAGKRLRCGYVPLPESGVDTPKPKQCAQTRAAHNETISIKRKGPEAGVRKVRPPKVEDHDFQRAFHSPMTCMAGSSCKHETTEIEIGQKYKYWTPRMGAKHTRHYDCPSPSRSFFTSSEILATAWDIADGNVDFSDVSDMSDAQGVRDDFAEQVREIVSMIEEKVSAIQQYFESSPTIDELEERGYQYDAWAEEIEAVDFSEFELEDEDACKYCGQAEDELLHYWDEEVEIQNQDFEHKFEASEEIIFDVEGAQEALAEVVGNAPE